MKLPFDPNTEPSSNDPPYKRVEDIRRPNVGRLKKVYVDQDDFYRNCRYPEKYVYNAAMDQMELIE